MLSRVSYTTSKTLDRAAPGDIGYRGQRSQLLQNLKFLKPYMGYGVAGQFSPEVVDIRRYKTRRTECRLRMQNSCPNFTVPN